MSWRVFMLKCALILFIICISFSQTRDLEATKTIAAITVDGLEEELWKAAKTYTEFVQMDPEPLAPANKKTEFKFMYDADNIYFYIKSYDNPNDIIRESTKRDNAGNGDYVLVALSPLNDKSSGYVFQVNPLNSQGDARLYNDGDGDWNWDGIWYSETRIEDDGWVAELQIPLRELKFQAKYQQDWGFNILRKMRKTSEEVSYEPIDPNYGFKVSRFAHIRNLKGLESKNELNVIPSFVTSFDSDVNYDPTKTNRNIGLDAKYNFDEQHSILATYKPDFAQIEADADEINLSDYPQFLREKRPFFLEGNTLYSLPDEVFYSRRMARPRGGFKFFGNSSSLKYGLTYVLNECRKDKNEHFVIPRIKFQHGTELEIGYLGGFVKTNETFKFLGGNYINKEDNIRKHGMLHTLDATFRPDAQFTFKGMAATTFLNDVNKDNRSLRLQAQYNSDTWYSYFRFQKKTNFFEQGLIGFPEANNTTEQNFNIGRLWRFKNSTFRRYRLNFNINHFGTYDNQIISRNLNVNMHFSHQYETLGFVGYGFGVNHDKGDHRTYKRVVADSIKRYDDKDATQFDNYGYFNKRPDDSFFFWSYFETDFSNPYALAFSFNKGQSLGGDFTRFGTTLQFRPSSDLKIKLNSQISHYGKSNFHLDDGTYVTYSARADYTIMPNCFAKVYTQYNPQHDRLSNNVIISYEYNRGSFLYFAYNETGTIEEDYKKGTLLKNYGLDKRTFSLKWSGLLYL